MAVERIVDKEGPDMGMDVEDRTLVVAQGRERNLKLGDVDEGFDLPFLSPFYHEDFKPTSVEGDAATVTLVMIFLPRRHWYGLEKLRIGVNHASTAGSASRRGSPMKPVQPLSPVLGRPRVELYGNTSSILGDVCVYSCNLHTEVGALQLKV